MTKINKRLPQAPAEIPMLGGGAIFHEGSPLLISLIKLSRYAHREGLLYIL